VPRRERLLLTGGQEIGVLAAARGLARAGFEIWVASHRPRSYAARSRSAAGAVLVPDPANDPSGFAQALGRATDELSIAAILPGTEAALIALAGRASLFPDGVVVGVPAPDVVDRATDKLAFLDIARRAGLETPPTLPVGVEDLVDPSGALSFPAVVKPLRSDQPLPDGTLAHAGPRLVFDAEDARAMLERYAGRRGVLQPYLPGQIYGVCAVAWEGELVCCLHQIGERIWPRYCGMVCYARTVARDEGLESLVAAFIRDVGWSGIFQIQLLRHRQRLYAIDLNPRIYISLALAIAAGRSLPAIWADLLLGRRPEVGAYGVGMRWRSDVDDPQALAFELLRGNRAKAVYGLVPRRRTCHAVFAWDDPGPAIVSVRTLVTKALRLGRRRWDRAMR
jgi:predicted ATP-grasp superfamily ATP-dependent carboligase